MTLRLGAYTIDLSAGVLKILLAVGVILGGIFGAGRLLERMSHDHRFLMHEMCRVEVRMGMDAPDECDRTRANATQAAETAVVQR